MYIYTSTFHLNDDDEGRGRGWVGVCVVLVRYREWNVIKGGIENIWRLEEI